MRTFTSFYGASLLACFMVLSVEARAQPVVHPPGSGTMADVPGRVIACSKQTTADIRLRCFDELTAAVVEMTRAASARNQFAWSIQDTNTNPNLGQERKITIAIASSEAIVGADSTEKKNSFFLVGSCSGKQISFYVAFPDKAYNVPMETVIRRGEQKLNITLYPSESGRAMGLWNSGAAHDALYGLPDINSVSFEFHDATMPVILNFDVRGAAEALRPLQAMCGP